MSARDNIWNELPLKPDGLPVPLARTWCFHWKGCDRPTCSRDKGSNYVENGAEHLAGQELQFFFPFLNWIEWKRFDKRLIAKKCLWGTRWAPAQIKTVFFWMCSEGGFVYSSELYLEGKIRGTHSHAPYHPETFKKIIIIFSGELLLSTMLLALNRATFVFPVVW